MPQILQGLSLEPPRSTTRDAGGPIENTRNMSEPGPRALSHQPWSMIHAKARHPFYGQGASKNCCVQQQDEDHGGKEPWQNFPAGSVGLLYNL